MKKEVIRIEGGHTLEGTVHISGAKNATVALIPAAVMADGPVTIVGVPDIEDVKNLTDILHLMNVKTYVKEPDHIVIDPTDMKNIVLDDLAVTKLRASYYFMGALLGKYKKVRIRMSGGCYLGPRPIDLHLKGFEALGAKVEYTGGLYTIEAEKLVGTRIFLDFASVGATINILMAAVFAEGRTTIENAAKEPEIIDVVTLLNRMGAEIHGAGTTVITIDGVKHLDGCFHEIIPDRIEAGTFITIAAAIGKEMTIENIIPQHIHALLMKLQEMGVDMDVSIDKVVVRGQGQYKAVDVKTQTYPGFATDLQAPLTALLTQASGDSEITETIYPQRFKQCDQLNTMGADIDVRIPRAVIHGPKKLYGVDVYATDLRCGACLIVAGLMAEGVTTIHDVYHIDRGYEGIDEKLTRLGAKIWREVVDE
ncbi:MAG: UDP-N-acetylglucosamine 1-carboxyvinyltransferase [Erysipelotrichales bacterium]|nr:UDP-N-acetylglucosamine 1-carboxyvinyltransferase [Erysipelotrichales bacterium]MBQ1387087.1 UDP-N-acetylglucosamine 1-carboxyvinyltransferase [Erysipelotrichales bacterium]MBQ2309555.1 UDP-N-acetylglucosamine 1-carboxyvinyltransferase [Erysipelotrichales bacterium]MBQ2478529.1 UDP-N-acetylglucosamine 1-carboxyvinyltransferase [Erysipelotrichales bacterium]MBQ4374783.1 UDP-N-acetylglucosamine 1-carboxyvinyltransferase [Erysipelotrichales bacterium]